jgi:hypothetical protein
VVKNYFNQFVEQHLLIQLQLSVVLEQVVAQPCGADSTGFSQLSGKGGKGGSSPVGNGGTGPLGSGGGGSNCGAGGGTRRTSR